MATHQSITINLLGQKINLKANEDPRRVQEVVDIVTEKIRKAEKRTKTNVPHHVALLALLEMASDLIDAKNNFMTREYEINQKSKELLNLFEAEFQ